MPTEQSPANFNRPPRQQFPPIGDVEIDIPAPPVPPEFPETPWIVSVLPVLGIGVMAIFYVLRASNGALFALPMLVLALFTIGGSVLAQRWRKRDYERRQITSELNYLRLLDAKRARLQAAQDAQLAILEDNFPPAFTLLDRALSPDQHLWERRPEDPDFAAFRLGIGRVPSQVRIRTAEPDVNTHALEKAMALADQYRFLPDAPIIVTLNSGLKPTVSPLVQGESSPSLGMCGKRAAVLKAVRSALCQLALTHAPQELHIHIIAPQAQVDHWRWLNWLPHASQSQRGGSAELIAFDPDNIRGLIGTLSQVIDERKEGKDPSRTPHLLVVIDGVGLVDTEAVFATLLREGGQVGASAICLTSQYEDLPGDCQAVVQIDDDDRFWYWHTGADGYELAGSIIDALSPQDAEHIARALSSVVMHETGGAGRIPQRVDFLDLLGTREVETLPARITARWRRPIPGGVLPHPVAIGRESLAVTTELLLDEDHHGPHGVLAGTTGSGKSELLQTLVCSLALEHDPRLLNLLLIDFKGGSTFNVFANLPHTVGMVTNLDGIRIRRALAALKAETQWRQQFLKQMNVRDITQYHRYYAPTEDYVQRRDYKPLPHLFILVDEFAQLAKDMPDFLHELVRTAQVGRSLGLHLILGTQSPMDVITDEMNDNLQFRICLRVQNIEASRAMLRRPDAAYLPAGWPGRGYFQVGERGVFKQFQTAYVGDDYAPHRAASNPAEDGSTDESLQLELVTDSGAAINLLPEIHSSTLFNNLDREPYTVARAISEMIVSYAQSQGIAWMPALLLPPLEDQITLAAPMSKAYLGGWNGQTWLEAGSDHEGSPIKPGSAPVGLLDDVHNRTQHPLWIHLNSGDQERTSRKDGHVLIIGAPGTGKTTFLCTLALSQALLHSPDALHMYFVSFTGAGLNAISRLPHSERVIHGTETERVRRLFGRLMKTLDERQADPTKAFKPIIMVSIDQYEQFRETCRDTHMSDFERLLNEGRAVGIYLVITASSVTAVPERVRALVQQRIALALGSSSDYVLVMERMSTPADETLPNGRGYVYSSPPLLCQISLPCLSDNVSDDLSAYEAMTAIVEELRAGYVTMKGVHPAAVKTEDEQSPAPIKELPTRIPLHVLPRAIGRERIVTPLGCYDDDRLSPCVLDWQAAGSHFVVTGPPGCGKTNLLHLVTLAAAEQHSPNDLRVLLVDFNERSLRALEPLKHVVKRVTDPLDLPAELASLGADLDAFYAHTHANGMVQRVPATLIVIDDYDAFSETLSANPDPLRQLRDHIRRHSGVGLHLWAAGYLERSGDPLMKYLLMRRAGFALGSKDSLHKLNVRTTGLPDGFLPEGRAFFPQGNRIQIVQTALVDVTDAYVQRINDVVWAANGRAGWLHGAKAAPTRNQRGQPVSEDTDIDVGGLIKDLLDEDEE